MKSRLCVTLRSGLLALAALLTVPVLPAQNSGTTTDDHGNSYTTATAVTLPSAVVGNLGTAGDLDFFKFTLNAPAVVTVTSSGTTDVVGRLLLGGGTKSAPQEIVTNNDGAGAPNFRLQQQLPAGTHYVSVYPAVYGTLGGYLVNFTVAAPSTDQPDITLGLGGADLPAGTLVDFGTAAPGATVNRDFAVGNVGTAALSIYSVRLTLTSTLPTGATMPFRITTSYAPTVDAGRQTTLRVGFQSNVAGTYTGRLSIVSNDGDEIYYDVPLRGISSGALPPAEIEVRDGAAVVPNNGGVNVGSTIINSRLNRTITIANRGAGELRITGYGLSPVSTTAGSNTTAGATDAAAAATTTIPMAFSIFNSTVPTSVPAGGTATFQISLFNLVAGNYAARLTLSNNDSDENPTNITFTGTVTPDTAQAEIGLAVGGTAVATGSTVAYGNNVTGVGITKDFVFSNTGTGTLNLTSWQLSIPAPAIVTNATTITAGSAAGTVANGATLAVGMGVSGPFPSGTAITAITGNAVTFSAPSTTTLTNATLVYYVGGPNATINAFRFDSGLPMSLAPGASATVKITYLPLQAGDHTATLRAFNNDADENPYTITLTGHCDVNPNPGDIAVALDGSNVAPDSTVDWGNIAVGTTSLKSFTVTNAGTGELRLTSFSNTPVQPLLSSTTPLYFYFAGTPSTVLPAGQSGSLVMVFKPTVTGTLYKSTLVISSTDPDESPYRINLTGTGTANTNPVADMDVLVNSTAVSSSGSFSFGSGNSGTLVQKSFMIYNTGSSPLTITGATVSQPVGTAAGTPQPFSLGVTAPITIAPGSSYGTWVGFAPTIAGSYTATIQLTSNDPDESPYIVNVTGTAVGTVAAPEIALSLEGVDVPQNSAVVPYGEIPTGSTLSKQFTITNSGDAPLTLTSWVFSLPFGSTLGVSTTTTAGSSTATVANATGIVAGMTVAGPFPAGTSVVSISGTTVTFSAAAASTTANTFISYFQPGVPITNQFRFEGTLPSSVPAGGSATFTLTYAPTVAGNHSMIARVNNNDISENPYQFTVTGSAVGVAPAPEIAVATGGADVPVNSSVAYGSTFVGTPVSKQFVISNSGNAPLSLSGWSFVQPVTGITAVASTMTGSTSATLLSTNSSITAGMAVTGPFPAGTSVVAVSGTSVILSSAATSTITASVLTFYPAGTNTVNPFVFSGTLPTSVAAGGTATVTVNYSPTAAGTHTMNLRFNNNDSNENPFSITLSGTATVNTSVPDIGVSLAGVDVPLNGSVGFGSIGAGATVTKQFVIANTGTAALNLSGYGFFLTSTGANVSTTTTAGSPAATVATTTGLSVGMVVVGPFPVGTSITSINGTSVTFSSAATSSISGAVLAYYPAGTSTTNPFRIDGTAPTSIAAGATATLNVTYAPTVAGTHSMLLRFNNNDSNENPYQFTVTGSATGTAAPDIAVFIGTAEQARSSTLDFGTIARGTTATKDFIIKNLGTANLSVSNVITALTPSGNTTSAFTVSLLSGSSTIVPNGSATFRVTFKPAALSTSYSAAYNINNNDPDENPYGFTLTGASLATDSEISVTYNGADLPINGTIDVGSATVGGTVAKTFTVTNTGAATLAISAWGMSPPTGTTVTNTVFPFYLTGGLVQTLAPGVSTNVTVVYRPLTAGTNANWIVTIANSDADEGTYRFNLTGSATASTTPPEVGVSVDSSDVASGGSLAFSSAVGVALTKDIVISNTGTDPLVIAGYWTVNSAPAGIGAFSTVQAPPSTIPPGGTGIWKVKFFPPSAGTAFAAKLTLHNTDPDESAYVINLTGATTP